VIERLNQKDKSEGSRCSDGFFTLRQFYKIGIEYGSGSEVLKGSEKWLVIERLNQKDKSEGSRCSDGFFTLRQFYKIGIEYGSGSEVLKGSEINQGSKKHSQQIFLLFWRK